MKYRDRNNNTKGNTRKHDTNMNHDNEFSSSNDTKHRQTPATGASRYSGDELLRDRHLDDVAILATVGFVTCIAVKELLQITITEIYSKQWCFLSVVT